MSMPNCNQFCKRPFVKKMLPLFRAVVLFVVFGQFSSPNLALTISHNMYSHFAIHHLITVVRWPCRDGTILPEFILSQGQASLLSEYLFICSDWCDNNCGSREFLMGQAFLQSGDHEKARQHFFKATKFIGK